MTLIDDLRDAGRYKGNRDSGPEADDLYRARRDARRAVCRGCGRFLNGRAYHLGGSATHPTTGERCPINFYGGFVCSEACDRRASLELESSMPGAGDARSLHGAALASVERNWPVRP